MRSLHSSILTFGALFCLAATAAAAPNNNGQGGGYHGSVKYTNASMSGVGPYATYNECVTALQQAIAHDIAPPPQGFGWTVAQVVPCHYRSGWTVGVGFDDPSTHFHDYVVPVKADTPSVSAEFANAILEAHLRLRREYNVDEYDRGLQSIEEAFGGR